MRCSLCWERISLVGNMRPLPLVLSLSTCRKSLDAWEFISPPFAEVSLLNQPNSPQGTGSCWSWGCAGASPVCHHLPYNGVCVFKNCTVLQLHQSQAEGSDHVPALADHLLTQSHDWWVLLLQGSTAGTSPACFPWESQGLHCRAALYTQSPVCANTWSCFVPGWKNKEVVFFTEQIYQVN